MPALDVPVRATQSWHGTDRQCRGTLLAAVRESAGPVTRDALVSSWADPEQAERCLEALVREGLLHGDETISLYG
jgi:A/G-specific adenine glycosylase